MKITLNLSLGIELPDELYHKLNVCKVQNKEETALTTDARTSSPSIFAAILRIAAILAGLITPLSILLPLIK